MRRQLALAALLAVVAGCSDQSSPTASPDAGPSAGQVPINHSQTPVDIAVIGDVPYGGDALAAFPTLIGAINDDPDVRLVVHVGDIKSGSTECSNSWFYDIADDFATFDDPLVYVIGDNEWTDCHRANNGAYDPLGRLDKIREIFFSQPGWTLGALPVPVAAENKYPENKRWEAAGAVFATFHEIGSNNGLDPWFTEEGQSGETPAQTRAREKEVSNRIHANVKWLEDTFKEAHNEEAAGVVLFFHADLYHPGDREEGAEFSAHEAFVEKIVELAADFDGPILLISGDSHDYVEYTGSPWLFDFYGDAAQPDNVTQIIVDRSIEDDVDWLRLHVDPDDPNVFSWNQEFVP